MYDYVRLDKEFRKNKSLCSLLQLIAVDTWNRVEFGRTRKALKIFETTITQNILYELFVYCSRYPKCPVRMFEAVNESINGNDIELCVKIQNGYVLIPLQAKIVDKHGLYSKIDHKNQIEDLIHYAKKVNGIL